MLEPSNNNKLPAIPGKRYFTLSEVSEPCRDANEIRILHKDGSMAIYAHLELEKAQVYPKDEVKAGQLIGSSGNTGYSDGPHLHFAVQINKGMKLTSVPFSFINSEGQAEEPMAGKTITGISN